jgi:hypothetical protein
MSILVDSLGPSYPSGAPPSLQGGQDSTSTAAPSPQTADSQRKGVQAQPEKSRPTLRRREMLMSGNPVDGSLDILSSLVDFELFEQSVQSPDEDNSRNNQAPADFDANVPLSDYGSLFDTAAATASTSSMFPSIF